MGSFALLSLTGEDRRDWLQGQVTNDLRSLTDGGTISFCLCTPTGQMLAPCDAWALPNRILVSLPRETAAAFLERVAQMVILEDVVAEDLTNAYRLVSVQGPQATERLGELLSLPSLDGGEAVLEGTTVYALRSDRAGSGGWDLWVPREAQEALTSLSSALSRVGHEAYDVARLEAGIPGWGSDMGPKTLPPEMGPAFEARYVSYTKGCYTGQEVLMRIHSRGHTNRTWMGLSAEAPLEIGALVEHPARADAGTVTSAGVSPAHGPIAAAMLRKEAAGEGEIVVVRTERGAVEAEVCPFTW